MYIIFDNNSARDLVSKKNYDEIDEYAKDLAKIFDSKNLKMLISPIVMMELLYHVNDLKNRDFSISKKTIKCLILINRYQKIIDERIMLAPAELLIANDLFNMKIDGRESMYSSILQCCSELADRPIDFIPNLICTNGETIVEYVDSIEISFATQVKVDIFNSINQISALTNSKVSDILNSKQLETILVTYITRTTYNLLIQEGKIRDFKETLKKGPFNMDCKKLIDDLNKNNEFILNRYPAFFLLFKELIKRVYESRHDIKEDKIKNYIWDILLMFNVSNLKLKGESVLFITGDKAMLKCINDENIIIWDFSTFQTEIQN